MIPYDSTTGVLGQSESAAGVAGESTMGTGVYGHSDNGLAAYLDGKVKITGNLEKAGGSFR